MSKTKKTKKTTTEAPAKKTTPKAPEVTESAGSKVQREIEQMQEMLNSPNYWSLKTEILKAQADVRMNVAIHQRAKNIGLLSDDTHREMLVKERVLKEKLDRETATAFNKEFNKSTPAKKNIGETTQNAIDQGQAELNLMALEKAIKDDNRKEVVALVRAHRDQALKEFPELAGKKSWMATRERILNRLEEEAELFSGVPGVPHPKATATTK